MQRQRKHLSQGIGDAQMRGVDKKHNMAKKQTIEPHTCFECCFAYLMRSVPVNPIVSECTITKERNVARTPIKCQRFKNRIGCAKINPMKFLK